MLKRTPNWDDCDRVGWMTGVGHGIADIAVIGKTLPLMNTDGTDFQ